MSARAASQLPAELATALGNAVELQAVPLVPELRLWLIAGHVDLNARCEELMRGNYAPYWAVCWGAGQALARYVLDHPQLVRGKVVVDFGAGSAIVALAAARAGAARSIAVDNDPQSCRVAAANAASNRLAIEIREALPEAYDVLLAADVLYDAEAALLLLDAAQRGATVFVSDPHRQGALRLPEPPLAELATTAFPDVDYPICAAFIHRVWPKAGP